MATRLEKITAALTRPSACPSTIKSTDKSSIARWREEFSPGTLEKAPVGTYIGVGSGILSLIGGLVTKHRNSHENSIFSSALNGLGAIFMGLGIGLSFNNQSLSNDATQVIDEANIIQSTGEQKQIHGVTHTSTQNNSSPAKSNQGHVNRIANYYKHKA